MQYGPVPRAEFQERALGPGGKLDFLRTTLDPWHYATMPPASLNQTTTAQTVSYNGVWKCDDSALVADKIPTTTGLIIWHCGRGVNTIGRFGIVPAKHVMTATVDGQILTFNSELAVPYKKEDNVTVKTPIWNDFSFTRMYAGAFTVKSTTIPIGATALNGLLTTGSIADTRDIAQKGGYAFASDDLETQTVVAKDRLKNIPVADGVTALMGGDIPIGLSQPNVNLTFVQNGGFEVKQLDLAAAVDVTFASASAIGTVGTWWVSPWDTQTGYTNVDLQNINMHGGLQFKTTTAVPAGPALVGAAMTNLMMHITMNHVYLQVDSTGTLVPSETGYAGRSYQISSIAQSVEFETIVPPPDHLDRGIYLGSCYRISYELYGDNAAPFVAVTMPKPTVANMVAIAYSLYQPGECGPTRVVRYDKLGNGQDLVCVGIGLVEAVPQGTLAPYLRSSAVTGQMSFASNLIPFLNFLYNGPSPFRRFYVEKDYMTRITNEVVPLLTMENLLNWPGMEKEGIHAAEAAGLFGDLGGAIGGLFGSGGRDVGQSIGQLGDIGMSLLGPFGAGQFGANPQAAGMFGGQRGYASSAAMYR